jgi:Flp pilus assembly protein CpaB
VAVAAIGTWWAASGVGQSAEDRYVVADRPIGPGTAIEPGDVRLAPLDLPAALRPAAFTDPDAVVGSVALGPLGEGELVQRDAIGTGTGTPDAAEVSFSLEQDWAVAGSLRAGDRIDVYATSERGEEPTSERVLAGAVVRQVTTAEGSGFGESRNQTITVSVTDPVALGRTVSATRAGLVTVVRVTGNDDAGAPADVNGGIDPDGTDDPLDPGEPEDPDDPLGPGDRGGDESTEAVGEAGGS